MVYALSEKACLPLKGDIVENTHVRSIKSVRSALGVLCNINLEKVIMEWKKKSPTHAIITPVVYGKMEARIRELQSKRLVRTRDN